MHLDPLFPMAVAVLFAIFLLGLFLNRLKLPHVVGYLIAGIVLGPGVLGLIEDQAFIARLGNMGVVLLLFFIGMEVSARRLLANWKISVLGTVAQIILSVVCVLALGSWLGWPTGRSVLIGFVISLSSTAVVLKILQDSKELDTDTGQNVLGVLLFQDMAIIPMVIIIGLMSGGQIGKIELGLQLLGGIGMAALVAWVVIKETIHFPLAKMLRHDHEMQIFLALIICFGLASLTGLFHLSTALGAFIGGMLIGAAKETQWVHHSLDPFRVLFVALFFVSVGLLVDTGFFTNNWTDVFLLTALVVIVNFIINTVIIRSLGDSWRDSIYSGALLSQVGEFSFVLAAIGFNVGIISNYGHQLIISVIVVSLVISPVLIAITRKLVYRPWAQGSRAAS